MFKHSSVVVVGMLTVGVLCRASLAQDPLLDELYGRGVHAYNRSEFDAAQRHFDSAIDQGSRDPRCFYFRGLVLLRSGRAKEAERDFQNGAALEYSSEAAYDIGLSLQRVQGALRLTLERARQEGRLAYLQRRANDERARYVQIRESDEQYVRKPSGAVVGATAVVPATVPTDPTDPFGDASRGPIGVGVAENVVPQPADAGVGDDTGRGQTAGVAADDPFAEDSFEAAPGADDPFASSPRAGSAGAGTSGGGVVNSLFRAFTKAIPGSEPAAAAPSSPPVGRGTAGEAGGQVEADDPFASDDPFGESETATEPPPPSPPADNEPDPGDDPFGEDSDDDPFAAPPEEPSAETGENPGPPPPEPADEDVDPFADDDPFAEG